MRRTSLINRLSRVIYEDTKQAKPSGRVPYAGVVFDRAEVKAAVGSLYDMFASRWFTIGKSGAEFEQRFAKYLGLKGAVLTNSGSSANLLAIAALVHLKYLKPGDEVLTPATTFPTTVNPLLLYGLRPVLVDLDLPSYTVDADTLSRCASSKTRGIMLPHLNGSASYMPEIMRLAKERGWTVIEDVCDALSTTIKGKFAGTFGAASTFSFYGAHMMCTGGEGGAVASNDLDFLDVVRSLRDWGRALGKEVGIAGGRKIKRTGKAWPTLPEDYEPRYTFATKGYNLKPLDFQAAIGLAQLDKLDKFTEARKRNYAILSSALEKYHNWLILPEPLLGVEPSWWTFPIVVRPDAGFSRREIVDHLEKKGIETRPNLAGNILNQPAYARKEFRVPHPLPNSDLVLTNGFFVGLFHGLNVGQVGSIVKAFDSFFSSREL